MKNRDARNKALKITVIYFIFGCIWILFSNKLVQSAFPELSQVFFYSVLKGLLYVLITSLLFCRLIYKALKETLDKKDALRKANDDLKKSNELYIELYEDNRKKQALLKALIDSVPDLIFYKDINGVYLGCNQAFESYLKKSEQDIIGLTDKDLFSESAAEIYVNTDKAMLNNKSFQKFEEWATYPNGERVIFETLKTPYYDFEGNVIGLIGISRDILTKTEKLSDEDWREIKKHPEIGYRIASSTFGLTHIAEYILCHHEHWNGNGYPLGLAGDNIPLISRIITIVDSFDAMTHDRAYRKAMSVEQAVEEIIRNKGSQFDPHLADIFVNKILPVQ